MIKSVIINKKNSQKLKTKVKSITTKTFSNKFLGFEFFKGK